GGRLTPRARQNTKSNCLIRRLFAEELGTLFYNSISSPRRLVGRHDRGVFRRMLPSLSKKGSGARLAIHGEDAV
ncbi:MAG: hypothetical protein RBT20_13575, partial [Syntrophales bacterium]|nr:hypothetical protein [Syntrophales bacterium]